MYPGEHPVLPHTWECHDAHDNGSELGRAPVGAEGEVLACCSPCHTHVHGLELLAGCLAFSFAFGDTWKDGCDAGMGNIRLTGWGGRS